MKARTTSASTSDTKHSLYTFDAEQVAWLETRMWEAYYARQDARLFLLLLRLVGSQFGVPLRDAMRIAIMLTRPAMQFAHMIPTPDSLRANAPIMHDASAYAFVIPDLALAYEAIRVVSDAYYDAETVARAELQWWIVHRHPTHFGVNALTDAIASLYAVQYVTNIARVHEAARLRAEAALICDVGRKGGYVRGAPYWREIHALLRQSYRSLRVAAADLAPSEPDSEQTTRVNWSPFCRSRDSAPFCVVRSY